MMSQSESYFESYFESYYESYYKSFYKRYLDLYCDSYSHIFVLCKAISMKANNDYLSLASFRANH